MSLGRKIFIGITVVVLVVVIGAGLFLRSLATKGIPDYDGTVILRNMTDEVIVYRDEYAIPHIYAKNEPDLYRAAGYCMAQDRLFQMDLIRRATTGRLSEIF